MAIISCEPPFQCYPPSMKILLFGATGMVGQGVLRECLLDPEVSAVLSVGRSALGKSHPKLQELVRADLFSYEGLDAELAGWDACFFCLGVSSAGMPEVAYRRVTFDLTLAAAAPLARLNPGMTFTYVSGQGTDSSEQGRVLWARVKGATENALLGLPFRAAAMFRPGMIEPVHGVVSKTPLYQVPYTLFGPLVTLLRRLFPNQIVTTEELGWAMLEVARFGPPKPVLETRDIRALVTAALARKGTRA